MLDPPRHDWTKFGSFERRHNHVPGYQNARPTLGHPIRIARNPYSMLTEWRQPSSRAPRAPRKTADQRQRPGRRGNLSNWFGSHVPSPLHMELFINEQKIPERLLARFFAHHDLIRTLLGAEHLRPSRTHCSKNHTDRARSSQNESLATSFRVRNFEILAYVGIVVPRGSMAPTSPFLWR